MKRFFIILFCSLFLSNDSALTADTVKWTNGEGNQFWSTPSNWDLVKVPGAADDPAIIKTGLDAAFYSDTDGLQSVWFISVGYGSGINGELWITGGTINAPCGLTFNKNGSSISNGAVYMSGGTLNLLHETYGYLQIGRKGTSIFNMTGGLVNCNSLSIPYTGLYGCLNLDGGTVSANSISIIPPNGLINIARGKLIITGDKISQVYGYVGNGGIIPYPGQTGRKIVNIDYDNYIPGKTIVTASKTEMSQAWNPVPMDGHPNVDNSIVLNWTPGDGAILHKIFVGIDINDVNNATEPLISTDVNSYSNGFVSGQTYYWRIDEFNGVNTAKGQVWSFTVAFNPDAAEPNPLNDAIDVNPDVNLNWVAGDNAIRHDVYFGTNLADVNNATDPNILPGRGSQIATTYQTGTLSLGQQYYWRIDEYNGTKVLKGQIWTFKVVSSNAAQPKPVDGASYVGTDVILRWTKGYNAISHNVYLGTASADVENATIPSAIIETTSYAPQGLELGQTCYWRIDENNGSDIFKGPVWRFATEPAGSMRAFPGAEGYGAYSLGGRGGDVYHVTNLSDDAANPIEGSFRYGINTATGPRTIVFDVSGYIELQNRLEITKPYITIAGQTAPGQGITFRKHDLRVYNTHDVIIRYIRVRVGKYYSGQYVGPGGLDALSIEAGKKIILDHVTTSWGVDELMSITSDSNDVTVQWCIMAEPLNCEDHSKCSLLRPAMTSRLTHHHNLYADVMKRVTRFGNYNDNVVTRFDWYNNVVFNWSTESTYSNDNDFTWDSPNRVNGPSGADGEFVQINFLDNYFIAGPSSSWFKAYQASNAAHHKIWASGIFTDFDVDAQHNGKNNGWDDIGGTFTKMTAPFDIASPYNWQDASTAYAKVLANSGSSFVRDPADERIVSQVNSRIGSVPDTQDDVGGFPVIAEVHRPADFDTDGDGMPNAWEIAKGLNLNNAADGAIDRDGDGYTNLEEYLNFLAYKGGELVGDFDKNGIIYFDDLAVFWDHWLENNCDNVPIGGLDFDCDVDFDDFAIFAQSWNNN